MISAESRLDVGALGRTCDPAGFDFERTDELHDADPMFGQSRAKEALDFGLDIRRSGYHIFVSGTHETAKDSLVHSLLDERSKADQAPYDWCYAYNFDAPEKPNLIRLPAGKSAELARDMKQFTDEVTTSLSAAFESEEYQTRLHAVQERDRQEYEAALGALEKKSTDQGLVFLRSPSGFAFLPAKDGSAMPLEEIQTLSNEDRKRLESAVQVLQEDLLHILRQVPARQRRLREAIRTLETDVTRVAVQDLMADLRGKYGVYDEVVDYLTKLEADIVNRARTVLTDADDQAPLSAFIRGTKTNLFLRYAVNPIVSNGVQGAHVVIEEHPTLSNLIGRIEYRSEMGTLVTDHTLIRPGALHQANGGYLLLDAHKLLSQPFSWETLKRALKTGEIVIRSVQEEIGLLHTVTLEPEPVPLDAKVILFGEPWLYHLLCALDPEFSELFHIQADFDDRVDRTVESERSYARLLAHLATSRSLRPLDRGAVARTIEYASRRAADSRKLSLETAAIADLLTEADHLSGRSNRDVVVRDDVEQALEMRRRRAGRVREHAYEEIVRGTILVDTAGAVTGQVNGLSVVEVGQDVFATPTRITATIQMGKGNVIDIEREVELGGPIHSKGVLILSSFLGARYAADTPLSLSASLVFEQSYGEIEGDSASVAELCALLSAIGGIPAQQALAITGSVNQRGVVQPIGAVNEKIEGFFAVCKARGLTGGQGVIIPQSNVAHLMLRDEVVDAVRNDQFAVYAVRHVDEAMELLTGLPMGEYVDKGGFPEGSINSRVSARLNEMAEERLEYLVMTNGSEEA